MGNTGADPAAEHSQAFAAAGDWLDVAHLRRGRDASDRRVVEIAPGERLDHDHGVSQDEIVLIAAGGRNVEQRHRLCEGDTRTLACLPVRSVHDGLSTPVRLLAIRRTPTARDTGSVAPARVLNRSGLGRFPGAFDLGTRRSRLDPIAGDIR